MHTPERISGNGTEWKDGAGQDPARYLVDPGKIEGPNKHKAGNLRHARPYLLANTEIFAFPVGPEGFQRSGSAQVGVHRYLGANRVAAHVFHLEEARLEMSGTFPGVTSPEIMAEFLKVVKTKPNRGYHILYMPGVFDFEQYVVPENWNFTHSEDDRSHSLDYTVSFVIIGEGNDVKDTPGIPPRDNPTTSTAKPRGAPARFYTVNAGARTLRAIAAKVYGSANKWTRLVELNQGQLADFQRGAARNAILNLPTHRLPTYRWPLGTKFRY